MDNKPIVSLITVCYNAEKSIKNLLESIKKIKSNQVEFIIVDGASNDGTKSIVNEYQNIIDVFVSEKDKGIYDAMNKGIKLASGEYIAFLGADDKLLNLPLGILEDASKNGIDCFCGNVQLSDGNIFDSKWNWKLHLRNTVHHQGLFVKRKVLKKYFFDLRYPILADFDLNQKLYKDGIKIYKSPEIISWYSVDGISATNPIKEKLSIIYKNYGFFYTLIAGAIIIYDPVGRCLHKYMRRFNR